MSEATVGGIPGSDIEQLLAALRGETLQEVPGITGRVIRNALDFVLRATEDLWGNSKPSKRDLKYSTVHLYEAIELLLKARLMREHWALVLADQEISKKTQADIEQGRFRSVDYKSAKDRLANIAAIEVEAHADKAFDNLRDLRNRYVHFECSESPEGVLGTQLRAWHYVLRMLEDGFLDPLGEAERSLLERARVAMLRSEEFLKSRLAEVAEEIKQARQGSQFVATCPQCEQPALAFGDGRIGCLVCRGYWGDPSEAADAYASMHHPFWKHPRHGVDDQLGWCRECDLQALAPAGPDLQEQVGAAVAKWPPRELGEVNWGDLGQFYVCFNCADVIHENDFDRCSHCGEMAESQGDYSMCPACNHPQ